MLYNESELSRNDMMIVLKNFFWFLSFMFFISTYVFGADSCTNPQEYTIDKRCYVTDGQKKIKPYNAVVGIIRDKTNIPLCSGTIVKEKNKLYLYTAKHCVIDKNSIPLDVIKIKTQDGKFVDTYRNITGAYYRSIIKNEDEETETVKTYNNSGDFAVYNINGDDLLFVSLASESGFKVDNNARVIGYGALKVMSDQEIETFRQKYAKYLKDKQDELDSNSKHGVKSDYVIGTHKDVKKFILDFLKKEDKSYYNDFFRDNNALKVSECVYSSSGHYKDCQSWGGNSGGGIFDKNGNIMGIHISGNRHFGGDMHAAAVDSINLQQGLSPTEQIKGIQHNKIIQDIDAANKELKK